MRTPSEIRRTMVLAVALDESSAKVRTGGPADEPEDLDGPHWGGSVPLVSTWAEPVAAPDLIDGVDPPSAVVALTGRRAFAPPPSG